jgi:hypothetical protein
MLKKTISYKDYNDNQIVEDFYFNLSKSEIAEMELEVVGGFSELLKRIIATKNNKELMAQFKKLILKSYGEKSADGKRFVKSSDLSEAFSQTEAYSELFFELMDADKAAAFVNGILPKELQELQNTKEYQEAQKNFLPASVTE